MHSLISKKAHWFAPILIPALVLGQVGCSGGAGQSGAGPSTSQMASTRYDGDALVRGLFFRTGPVAEKLPDVWALATAVDGTSDISNTQIEAQLGGLVERLQARGETAQAAKLAAIQADVRSGKLDLAALGSSATLDEVQNEARAESVVARLNEAYPGALDAFAVEVQSGDHVRVSAALAAMADKIASSADLGSAGQSIGNPRGDCAIAVLAVAVVAALWIAIWKYTGPKPQVAGQSGLQRDDFVNTIVERLTPVGE